MKTLETRKMNASGQLMGTPMNPEPAEATASLTFTPPEGLELKGDKGTATITWERGDDGQIVINSVDGVSLDSEAHSEPEGDEPEAPGENESTEV